MMVLYFCLLAFTAQERNAFPSADLTLQSSPGPAADFNKEVQILRDFVSVADFDFAGLSTEAAKLIRAGAKKRNRPHRNRAGCWIWPELYEEILPLIRERVAEKSEYDAFLKDLRLRQQFDRQFSVDSHFRFLDRTTGLSREQQKTLRPLLEKLYNRGEIGLPAYRGPQPRDVVLLFDKLGLSDEQQSLWKLNSTDHDGVNVRVDNASDDSREDREEQLREQLKATAAVRIRRIEAAIDLDKKTKRKLQVAAKGAIRRVVTTRIKAEDDLSAAQQKGESPAFDSELYQLATSSRHFLFGVTGDWEKLIKSSISDEQWEELERIREQNFPEAMRLHGARMLRSMGYNLKLDGQAKLKVRDFFAGLVSLRDDLKTTKGTYATYKQLYKIPKEKYVELMGEENYERFAEVLESYRSYFPEVESEKEPEASETETGDEVKQDSP